ncbi:MAG: hypothetical protein AABW73_01645 [Nanoarchaeota archaeon]
MKPTLHIVHPYTYKVKGDTLLGGPFPEFRERDEKISLLVRRAIKNGTVMRHYSNPMVSGEGFSELGCLLFDPLFKWSVNKKIIDLTTSSGVPISDVRPEKISPEDWEICKRHWTTKKELARIVSDSSPNVFIGGYLENCVTNAVGYHQKTFRKKGEVAYYVPELCARSPDSSWDEIKPKLEALDAKEISFEKALGLFVP